MKNAVLYLIFSFVSMNYGLSQSAILDQYIAEGLSNNLSIKSEQLKAVQQQTKVQQAKKNWAPSVDFTGNYLVSEGGRTIIFPVGDLFNPVYGSLNQLTQTNSFPTDLENEEITLTPNNFLDVSLSISKPIINSSIKYNTLIQQELLSLNDADIAISKENVKFQIRQSYYNYLKTIEGFKIIEENEALLEDLLRFNRKLVKYDKATSEILSDVEFQLANLNSQRISLEEQNQLAKNYFNLLLNKNLEEDITIDTDLLENFLIYEINLKEEQTKALNNRTEFQKIIIAQSVNQLNQQRIDKEKQPEVGIRGNIGLQTEDFDLNNGGPIYTLALGMNWNILDWGRRNKRIEEVQVQQKILDNNNAQLKQQVEIEVAQVYYALQSLASKLKAEQAALNSATEAHRLIKTRYENDKALLIQLTDARNKMINSKLNQLLIKYDYLSKLAELQRLTES